MYSKKTLDNFFENELSNSNLIFGGLTGEDDDDIEKDKAAVPTNGN